MTTQFLPLAIPPGVRLVGTDYSAKGRYVSANLVRWRDKVLRPIGGWNARGPTPVTGKGRCTEVWRDNANNIWIGVGTEQGLFVQTQSGALSNITPSGFVDGHANATGAGGYGFGTYGSMTFGGFRPTDAVTQDATTWSLDTFGPYLVGVSSDDQTIYEWQLNTSTPAAKITNSPPCSALFVTGEHMIMALEANGDARQAAWCDQADNTQWTASNTNTAGSNELSTNGRLMCGRAIQGGNLIFTDVDLWLAVIQQNQLIYAFTKVGDGCGIISRGAALALGSQAMWMGESQFFSYNGAVTVPVDCEVADFVFGNLNYQQKSKTAAVYNSLFNEATWFYQSNAGTDIDSYVSYNTVDNWWTVGTLSRLSGQDRGALNNPVMVGPDGLIYEHETGTNWAGAAPFALSGPVEIGNGDQVAYIDGLIPDEETLGDVTATFNGKFYPMDSSGPSVGPLTLASKTDFRLTARQVEVLYQSSGGDFRVGAPRLKASGTSRR